MYCYFKILLLLSPGGTRKKKHIVLIEDLALGESIFDLPNDQ
jgi:hypothetical protein